MLKINSKFLIKFSIAIAMCIILLGSMPHGADAQEVPYGGWIVSVIPCTCSLSWYITYLPPFPIGIPFVTRSLVLTPATFRYALAQYLITPVPTTWHRGFFEPGVQACLVISGPTCIILPSDGVITRVGSSAPGFVNPF